MNTVNTSSSAQSSSGLNNALDRINAPGTLPRQTAAAQLDAGDFLKLMTAQLTNQDPSEPQSNEQMLAQLAQFSTLENQTASRSLLDDISRKLDALIEVQERANAASDTPSQTPASDT